MRINIQSIDINYIQYGSGKDIILLHGWGQNIQMMQPIGDRLKGYRITILDLPGFGESSEPINELTIYDYSHILEELVKKLKIKDPIIIGHSFGGRIAIVYAATNKVNKLVLLGSPYKRRITKITFKVKVLKAMKKVPVINKLEDFAKRHIGSRDYKNASSMMRKILVNTVNEDLGSCLEKITCPVLLIYGSNDQEVSIDEAREMETLLKDGGLVILEGASHYAYLERLDHVINILKNFIGGN